MGSRVVGNRKKRRLRVAALVLAGMALFALVPGGGFASARPGVHATPTPPPQAAVINVNIISAQRAAATLRALFPRARIRVDEHANAVVVVASPGNVQQMRTVIQGIDVRNPQTPATEVVQLHILKPAAIIPRLRVLYPNAHVEAGSKTTRLIRAVPQDMTDIKAVISSLDIAPPTTAPTNEPADAVHVTQTNPRTLARALVREIPGLDSTTACNTPPNASAKCMLNQWFIDEGYTVSEDGSQLLPPKTK